MSFDPESCCVLLSGEGAWAFEDFAHRLAANLRIEVSAVPRKFNYLVWCEESQIPPAESLFIPLPAIRLAADKRLLADVFLKHAVPTPRTFLVNTREELRQIIESHPQTEWCLKFPTSCGASGHRLIGRDLLVPQDWPLPFVVQEFVRMERPEVYRTYGAAGEIFGWVARKFPEGTKPSPWVAHARGARYERAGNLPDEARKAARTALAASGLLNSSGCADLIRKTSGEWVVLEVGTDGLYNHVDREVADTDLENELNRRLAEAFWQRAGTAPWKPNPWHAQQHRFAL